MADIPAMKKTALAEAMTVSLPIAMRDEKSGRLIPVGPWILGSENLICKFTEWRNYAMEMFFSHFTASLSSTERYLEDFSLAQNNRILFVIQSEGDMVGHIGLAHISNRHAEIDNVIRGERTNHQNLMFEALKALVSWAFSELRLNYLELRVTSDNWRAKDLYERVGFRVVQRSPLRKITDGETIHFVRCDKGHATESFTSDLMTLKFEAFPKKM